MQEKTLNIISCIVYGKPLSGVRVTGDFGDVWDYEAGIEFFISLFLTEKDTGNFEKSLDII